MRNKKGYIQPLVRTVEANAPTLLVSSAGGGSGSGSGTGTNTVTNVNGNTGIGLGGAGNGTGNSIAHSNTIGFLDFQ